MSQLPRARQRTVSEVLDSLLAQSALMPIATAQTDKARDAGLLCHRINEPDPFVPVQSFGGSRCADSALGGLLPELAQLLGVSVDELLGVRPVRRAKKTDTRLQRRLQQVDKLDGKERRQVLQLLDAFIERAQLKRAS